MEAFDLGCKFFRATYHRNREIKLPLDSSPLPVGQVNIS